MSYLLDANVFIDASNRHYGLDFCPAYWEWLIHAGNKDVAFSIDKVADEIRTGDDELSRWASGYGKHLFRSSPAALAPHFSKVGAWANDQHYTPAAINTFFQAADFYLLAHALAGGHVIVTLEVIADSRTRIKIPNACIGLGVQFMTPYQMLRIEKARFVLGAMSP